MTSAVALAHAEHAQVETLVEVADRVNREHGLAAQSFRSFAEHAINAGEGLLVAKAQVKPGTWTRWLAEHFDGSHETAIVYMSMAGSPEAKRIAREAPSLSDARRRLRAAGIVRERHGSHGGGFYIEDAARDRAREMRREGMKMRDIAAQLGCSLSTVCLWVNPDAKKRQAERDRVRKRRRTQGERLLRERETTQMARQAGGSLAEAYSLARKLAQALERAEAEATNRDRRHACAEALRGLYPVEDNIARGLKSDARA